MASLLSSLQLGVKGRWGALLADGKPWRYWLDGPIGRGCDSTQIYEGTNQIQRVVVAKRLLG